MGEQGKRTLQQKPERIKEGLSKEVTLGLRKYARQRTCKDPRWDQAEDRGQGSQSLLESQEGPERGGSHRSRDAHLLTALIML